MQTPAEIKQEIGARLKSAREAAGYATAKEFCDKNNLPLAVYQQHESGERGIKASNAQEYAKLLNVKLTWLLLGDLI